MTTPDLVTPWRAGIRPGEGPSVDFRRFTPDLTGAAPSVLVADISEFQPDIADATYIRDFSPAIIIRAMYGDQHDDGAWYGGARRAALHAAGARFIGIYQYIVAGQDVLAQADALGNLLGSLQKGELVIADIEEGAGDQNARYQKWANRISQLGNDPWDYSGENFANDHNLVPVDWIAAYSSAEPAVPHLLWQFTNAFTIPGVGVADCSIYHGTIDQLCSFAFGGTQPNPQPPPVVNWTENLVNELATITSGATGEDVKSAQGLLCSRGYPVSIDGSFGPNTRAAVEALQQGTGIVMDGIVGPDTWAKLLSR